MKAINRKIVFSIVLMVFFGCEGNKKSNNTDKSTIVNEMSVSMDSLEHCVSNVPNRFGISNAAKANSSVLNIDSLKQNNPACK